MAEPADKTPAADEESVRRGLDDGLTGPAWMYRRPRIGPLELPYYASPMAQLLILSFVCFLCPGMFNAVTGLGGGGQVDPHDTDRANTGLYSTFAVVGFFAGSVVNVIGQRLTLFFGGFGYFLYVASLLCYNYKHNAGFLIFAGCLLGLCAGLLWSAQGSIIMSYPEESRKGRYFAIFWVIFNLGGVIGSLIPLGENLHSSSNTVSNGTYIAFMVLQFVGFLLAFTLIDAKYVRRTDGSRILVMKHPSWRSEMIGLYQVLRSDYYIIGLWPMFLASNWFTTYQFNSVNDANFTVRTRSLNSLMYWLFQMIGAFIFGRLLDSTRLRRSVRARVGWCVLFALTMGVWGGGYAFQRTMPTRSEVTESSPRMDWTSHGFGGPFVLFLAYGFYDSVFQTFAYWFMGAMSNNGRKLAYFAAFYKGIQSAGAAGTWA